MRGQLTFPHPDFAYDRPPRNTHSQLMHYVRRYLRARREVEGADVATMLDAIRVRDQALHDLILAAGEPCDCDPGSCPGLDGHL